MRIYEYKDMHGFNFFDIKYIEKIKWNPHNHHDFCEVILYLGNSAEFVVEGNYYPIKAYDIIFTRCSEFHHIKPLDDKFTYKAFVCELYDSFFENNDCLRYKDVFLNRALGVNNLIPSEIVKKYKLDEIIRTTADFLMDEEDEGYAAKCKIAEFLYLMNRIILTLNKSNVYHNQIFNSSTDYSTQVRDIILYINENITSEINLNKIAEHFYISKSHLCHSFKKHTGYSVSKYIALKRIALAHNLAEKGYSWLEASIESGFRNYSNFYKIYRSTYGCSPSKH